MPSSQTNTLIRTVKETLSDLNIADSAKILVGVSGGVDSMVLVHILHTLNYKITVAHVNFQLRGLESDEDAFLVRNWCASNNISYFEYVIDTEHYKTVHGLNVQSAAREIRYKWWDELVVNESFEYLATAHHKDDSAETFFLNVIRGTGIKGLTGIPAKRGYLIRPLINVSRKAIEEFAAENNIAFRTDRSNESDDYQRNRIRHHLIPLLREFAHGHENFLDPTLRRTKLEWEAWENIYGNWQKQSIVEKDANAFEIHCSDPEYPFLLRWLEEKGFPWLLSYEYVFAANKENGKTLQRDDFVLSRTKTGFHLSKTEDFQPVVIHHPGVYQVGNNEFSIEEALNEEYTSNQDPELEFINRESIKWPLQIRNVLPGDQFQPLGMKGRSKKLQDFFVDLKLDHFEKKETKVLVSGDDIIWVMGMRLNENAKVHAGNTGLYKLGFRKKKR